MYANCRYIHTIGVLYTVQNNGNYIQLIYILNSHKLHVLHVWGVVPMPQQCMDGGNKPPRLSTGEIIAPLGCGCTHVQSNVPSHNW